MRRRLEARRLNGGSTTTGASRTAGDSGRHSAEYPTDSRAGPGVPPLGAQLRFIHAWRPQTNARVEQVQGTVLATATPTGRTPAAGPADGPRRARNRQSCELTAIDRHPVPSGTRERPTIRAPNVPHSDRRCLRFGAIQSRHPRLRGRRSQLPGGATATMSLLNPRDTKLGPTLYASNDEVAYDTVYVVVEKPVDPGEIDHDGDPSTDEIEGLRIRLDSDASSPKRLAQNREPRLCLSRQVPGRRPPERRNRRSGPDRGVPRRRRHRDPGRQHG